MVVQDQTGGGSGGSAGGNVGGTGAQSGQGNQYLTDAGILAPTGGGGSSMYGLNSQIAKAQVLGSPFPTADPSKPVTAEEVMKAFAESSNPALIAQLQMYLYKGGFYGSSVRWQDINLGVIRPDDLSAMAGAVEVAAQTQSDISDYIKRQAAWGVYTGSTSLKGSSRSGSGFGASVAASETFTKSDPKAIGAMLDKEFKQILGHKPSAAERAGFIAAFQAAERQNFEQNLRARYAATTGAGSPQPVSGSSAPPDYEQLIDAPGDPRDIGENMRLARAAGIASFGDLDINGVTGTENTNLSRAAVYNYNVDQRNAVLRAQDNAFLALADQPLPGMVGYGASAAGAGAGVNVIEQTDFDPQAWADEWIQQHHTAEAGAHSATDKFEMFLNLLGNPVH